MMETHYVDCQCTHFNHTIRFMLDPSDGELWLEVHMNYCDPWYKRAWNAVRYVFKRTKSYGHFDTTILREEDYDRLRDMLNRSELAKVAARSRST